MEGRCASVETQTCDEDLGTITALPQLCIDRIGKHLDLKSLLSLQLTSWALFHKCIVAQRLVLVDAAVVIYQNDIVPMWELVTDQFTLKYTHPALMETHFRLRAKELRIDAVLTPSAAKNVTECFARRWSAETLVVKWPVTVDSVRFDELIKTLKVTGFRSKRAPLPLFDLPSIKQLTSLWTSSPLPISYLSQSAVTRATLRRRASRQDSADMNRIIKMWRENKRDIQKIKIYGFRFREGTLFSGLSAELVLSKPLYDTYLVKREDGAELFIRYYYLDGIISLSDPDEDWEAGGWQVTEGSDNDPSYEERFL